MSNHAVDSRSLGRSATLLLVGQLLFTLGLAVAFAAAVVRTAPIPRPMVYLMTIAGLTYLAQGWLSGTEGFSQPHTIAIILDELLNATWMTWLLVVAWRMPLSESAAPRFAIVQTVK